MTKTNQNIEIWAGDAKSLVFGILNSAGTGQDMTGNSASWILQDEDNSVCTLAQINGTMSGSTVTVVLAASHTNILVGYYYHELASTASGSPATLAVGTAKINKSSI